MKIEKIDIEQELNEINNDEEKENSINLNQKFIKKEDKDEKNDKNKEKERNEFINEEIISFNFSSDMKNIIYFFWKTFIYYI